MAGALRAASVVLRLVTHTRAAARRKRADAAEFWEVASGERGKQAVWKLDGSERTSVDAVGWQGSPSVDSRLTL
jgi:hypothetical protein